ncbi:hypothetical protein FGIG_06978 [Fasciola gigantica]|uniref:DUF4209 domain-containing protein n=1 Tax=Fasciola gigantica TaxID=46835 RepID=A0A504YT89_FASGI|nr:hypothetical protein FGIG_06978 [Fasciola gigantica]
MSYPSSFLSPYARSLLTRSSFFDAASGDLPLNDNSFVIDFDFLHPPIIASLSDHNYAAALDLPQPYIHRCYLSLCCISPCTLYTDFSDLIVWLSDLAEFLDLFGRLPNSSPSEKMLIMVRLFSLIEFSLGRLYWKPKQYCANTMKNLLSSAELEELLGFNCILVLQLLFGPVNSMNLRNLFWHGFVSPIDIKEMGLAIFYFPFAIVLSIGKRLLNKKIHNTRPSRIPDFLLLQESLNSNLPYLPLTDLALTRLVHATPFSAYFEFIDSLFSKTPIPYLDALCMLLICLSKLLRCEFAAAFDWIDGQYSSEDRLFVTIDSILQFEAVGFVPHPVTATHFERFSTAVDRRVLAVLCDVLSAENGPRIRDRLSHGELGFSRSVKIAGNRCIFENVDHYFKNSANLLRACLVSVLATTSKRYPDSFDLREWLSAYIPLFHPIGVLVLKVLQIQSSLNEFLTLTNRTLHELNFRWSLEVWFPSTKHNLTLSQSTIIDQLWYMLSAWNLLSASSTRPHWSVRPTAIASRLDLILSKHLNALRDVIEVARRMSLRSELSSRQLASKDRFEICVVNLGEYSLWLIQLTTLIWLYCLGGAGSSIRDKLDVLFSQTVHSASRAKLIGLMDRASDKLLMWIRKSKWEQINSFFENFPPCFT